MRLLFILCKDKMVISKQFSDTLQGDFYRKNLITIDITGGCQIYDLDKYKHQKSISFEKPIQHLSAVQDSFILTTRDAAVICKELNGSYDKVSRKLDAVVLKQMRNYFILKGKEGDMSTIVRLDGDSMTVIDRIDKKYSLSSACCVNNMIYFFRERSCFEDKKHRQKIVAAA